MKEILWHGRGGQGAFTAARLLGAAGAFPEGRYSLAFPSFGPERRGAPMRAFTKVDDKPIGDRSAVSCADYVVYLDDTLFGFGWAAELKPSGKVLLNTVKDFGDERIISIDADGISQRILGRPIPNTVFLACLLALDDTFSYDDIRRSIHEYMPAKLHAKNLAVVDAVLEELAQRGIGHVVSGAELANDEEPRGVTKAYEPADGEGPASKAERTDAKEQAQRSSHDS